ncbi:MAG: OmpA family protein [Saprospiraceae bacterium]|nr:OmpA family protein [Saprospiraceae bacterium]
MKTKLRSARAFLALLALFCATHCSLLYANHITPDPLVVVTDGNWEVSASQTNFTTYTLSSEQLPANDAPLKGGSRRPVKANMFPGSRVIPGTQPIWITQKATDGWESYQFRRNVDLGKYPVKKAILMINCDDAARVYINRKPVIDYRKSARLYTRNGREQRFEELTACLWSEVNTYDVTSYFDSDASNTILVEMANQPYCNNHAYLSAKIVIEFEQPVEKPGFAAGTAIPTNPHYETVSPTMAKAKKMNPEPVGTDIRPFDGDHPVSGGKLKVGTVLELSQVYFKPDDYALDDASYRTLSALASYLKKNKKLTIEVGGHTNLKADDKCSMQLSQLRAKAVADVLVSQGVAAGRVTFKGYGNTQPKMSGTSGEANQLNQRVEVKITGI